MAGLQARAERQGYNVTLEKSSDPSAGEVDLSAYASGRTWPTSWGIAADSARSAM
jgi:hypothetical protein